MLYVTLNSRRIKMLFIRIALVALAAALFCLWAIAARNNQQNTAGISASDTAVQPPAFNVLSPTEIAADEPAITSGQSEAKALPAHVSLYPFTINQSVALPVENASISSAFGFRDHPIYGEYSFHSGLDLAAPEGTDIHAMFDGSVLTARYADDYGNYIILDHGGFHTLYAHCSTLCVSEGDIISSGQKIAEVGSTGRATGSHVHVEFRCDGQRYDPAVVLGASYS